MLRSCEEQSLTAPDSSHRLQDKDSVCFSPPHLSVEHLWIGWRVWNGNFPNTNHMPPTIVTYQSNNHFLCFYGPIRHSSYKVLSLLFTFLARFNLFSTNVFSDHLFKLLYSVCLSSSWNMYILLMICFNSLL